MRDIKENRQGDEEYKKRIGKGYKKRIGKGMRDIKRE